MPSIRITDQLGANIDAELAPASSLLKYVREVPALILGGEGIQQLQLFTLNDPAVRSLQPSLSFTQPVSLGTDGTQLTIGADAGVSFRVIARTAEDSSLFAGDDYGENIEIPANQCYVAVGFHAGINTAVDGSSGQLSFGMAANSGIEITSYCPFGLGAGALTVTEALRQAIGTFVIPADAGDIRGMAAGSIVTVTGSGKLAFSATANLLAVVNPLATLALPAPTPSLSLAQTGSVRVGASWEITGEYQVRVQKIDQDRARLGWYRKHGSEFNVTVSGTAGLDAGAAAPLLPAILGAISGDAAAQKQELQNAGLTPDRAASIESAVKAAVNRKLEVAISAGWASGHENEAAFLYEVDLRALHDDGDAALRAELAGNFTSLANPDALPAGITELRSILTQVRSRGVSWNVNLLGIFNFASVSKLALNGSVTFTPSTGDLVIADEATASRIQTAAVNFGADDEKLRHVLAESFLLTAAYRGSRTVVAPPELSSSHVFFRLDNHTGREQMRRSAAIVSALGLGTASPADVDDFGRTTVFASASYDDPAAQSLFLTPGGTPRPVSDYEAAGRQAVVALVPPEADDAFRLRPATDDSLWNQMKQEGPANFDQLLPATQADGVRPDYLAIRWWADAMHGTAQILAGMAPAAPDDPQFQHRREELASHLRDVAAKAHEQFGQPWGLIAMFLAAGRKPRAEVHITGPKFVLEAESARGAAG